MAAPKKSSEKPDDPVINTPEPGTEAEALAAAAAAGVSLSPEVPASAPPDNLLRRVKRTINFSLFGQMVTWREGEVIDLGGYGGLTVLPRILSSGVELEKV